MALHVQWEGQDILPPNFNALQKFRKDFPSINLIHFVNPAYFTKGTKPDEIVAKTVASALKPGDSLGLHLLPWKSLAAAANVPFRKEPTFWGTQVQDKDCRIDCGREVPISAYASDEIRSLIAIGKRVLASQGFPAPRAIMAGGWMATNQVLDASTAEGFEFDFSAVPPGIVEGPLKPYPIYKWIVELWGTTSTLAQPTALLTKNGPIVEVINNAGSIDYNPVETIQESFAALAEKSREHPNENFVFSLGLYQETAAKNIQKLRSLMAYILKFSRERGLRVESLRLPERSAFKRNSDKKPKPPTKKYSHSPALSPEAREPMQKRL